MNKLLATATALALGLGAMLAPAADAAPQEWRDRDRYEDRYDRDRYDRYDRNRYQRHDRDDRQAKHWGGRDRWDRWDRDRRWDRDWDRHRNVRWDRDWRWDGRRYRAPIRYVAPRGYYSYRWRTGHRLPSHWYGSPYYVDHRYYNLAAPPYGHRWVRVDNDVFLVALTSGLITYALHDIFH